MDESVICIEDSIIEIIDLSEAATDVSLEHSQDDSSQTYFLRKRNTEKTGKGKKAMKLIPAEVIDLSNESNLSSPLETQKQTTNSLDMCCPVCLENFSTVQMKATTCGHVFCSQCIEATVKSTHTCPKCRKKLTMKNLIPIYM